MIALNAHYDGKVIVPDEPLDLPANQKVRINIEPIATPRRRVDLSGLARIAGGLPDNPHPRFPGNDTLWDKSLENKAD